jgi:hypothetical protein
MGGAAVLATLDVSGLDGYRGFGLNVQPATRRTDEIAMPEQERPQQSATPLSFAPKPVKFVHQKCAQYRIFHADGGWGVINGFGNVQIDFCVEHPSMPTAVIHPVKPDGNYTGEQVMKGLDDQDHYVVIREFQFGVVLSLAAAMQIHSVLDSFIKTSKQQVDSAIAQIKKSQ